ncbi:MAG: class II aldolase/adducin family protein [Bacteroidales bacterium]|nr:class II aldolase/adducin family protein [Bacteroidales bacterium]
MEQLKEKERVAYFMRRMYEQRLTTSTGGNISLKVGEKILITPSQTDKARMVAESIGSMTLNGRVLSHRFKASMENKMHLAIYHKRPDVKAIIHGHPIFATSFAICGKKVMTNLAGESRAILGEPVMADYKLMGTQELADVVAEASLRGNVILMENHGVITLGDTLVEAFDRIEVLEAAAKMTLITQMIGNPKELNAEELKEIDNLFE